MMRLAKLCRAPRLALCLMVLIAAVSARGQSEPPSPGPLVLFEQRDPPDVSFKSGWDETWKENRSAIDRFAKEHFSDRDPREEYIRRASVHLRQQMIERFGNLPDKVGQARLEIAHDLRNLGAFEHSSDYARQAIRTQPGNTELAIQAVRRIIDNVRSSGGRMEHGDAWLGYAIRRLAALAEVPDAGVPRSLLAEGYQAVVDQRLGESRYAEAAEAVATLQRIAGESLWTHEQTVRMLLRLGHVRLAREALEAIPPDLVRDDRDRRTLDDLTRDVAKLGEPAGPSVLEDFGLAGRWRGMADRDPTAAEIAGLIAEDPHGAKLVPTSSDGFASAWAALDQLVADQPPLRAALAEQQASAARRALDQAISSGRTDDLLRVFRTYPHAPAAHEALVRLGERAMWDGDAGLGAWALGEAARRSDGELRRQALAGYLMAVSQLGDAPSLLAAVDRLDPGGDLPWPTGPTPARLLVRRLEQTATTRSRDPGAQTVQALSLPPVATMPMAHLALGDTMLERALSGRSPTLASRGRYAVTAGPEFVSVWDVSRAEPLWWRQTGGRVGEEIAQDDNSYVLPGPLVPAMDAERVYLRWGLDPQRQHMRGLAAFDLATGQARWMVGDAPPWNELQPVTDPVVAGDRLYVLAMSPGMLATVQVVALEADTGQVAWRRALATQSPTIDRDNNRERVDVASYADTLTVHGGQVYVATNLGLAAKLNAVDGAVQWTRTYPRATFDNSLEPLRRRRGGPPMVWHDRVVFTPRDYLGAFALDLATGAMLWQSPFVAGVGAAGRHGGGFLDFDERSVGFISARTGQPLWRITAEASLQAPPVVASDTAYALTRDRLLEIDLATGAIRSTADTTGQELLAVTPAGNRLLALSATQFVETQAPEHRLSPARIDRPRAVVLDVRGDALPDDTLLTLAAGKLERWDLTDQGAAPQWRRLVDQRVETVGRHGQTLILVQDDRVLGIDLRTGRTQWRFDADHPIARWSLAEDTFYGVSPTGRDGDQVLALNLRNGEPRWTRRYAGQTREYDIVHAEAAGGRLYLTGIDHHQRKRRVHQLIADADTGNVLDQRRLFEKLDDQDIDEVDFTDGQLTLVTRNGRLHVADLATGKTVVDDLELHRYPNSSRWVRVHRQGDWWLVHQYRGGNNHYFWPVHRSATGRVDRQEHRVHTLDDVFVRQHNRQLYFYRPNAEKHHAVGEVQREAGRGDLHIEDIREVDGRAVVLATEDPRRPAERFHLDTFDASGERLSRQTWRIPDAEDLGLELRRAAGRLWLRAPSMLVHLDPADDARPVHRIAPLTEAPVIDGDAAEWSGGETFALQGPDGDAGTVRLGHRDGKVYLYVEHAQQHAAPLVVGDAAAAGNRLELAIIGSQGARRFILGLDQAGRLAIHGTPNTADAPDGLDAAAVHRLSDQALAYELELPLRALSRESVKDKPRLSVSLSAWSESPGQPAPQRLWWGSGLTETGAFTAGHQRVELEPASGG